MRLPSKPCTKPGCPNLNCTEHSNARDYDQARRDSRSREIYNSSRWRKLRLVVLRRDVLCRVCGDAAATIADHIVPIEQGGDAWSVENLQGVCVPCHNAKTASERTAARG